MDKDKRFEQFSTIDVIDGVFVESISDIIKKNNQNQFKNKLSIVREVNDVQEESCSEKQSLPMSEKVTSLKNKKKYK